VVCETSIVPSIKPLPTQLFINDFVSGIEDCNYEIYLRELVNRSEYFRGLSKGPYSSPPTEDDRQCDCIGSEYEFDFKLLISHSYGLASREFSYSISSIKGIAIIKGRPNTTPKDRRYKPINASFFHNDLLEMDFDALCKFEKEEPKPICRERDYFYLLKDLRTPKNLLCYFPFELYFEDTVDDKEAISIFEEEFKRRYSILVEYREKMQDRRFDTYFSFVYNHSMVFLKAVETGIECIDVVKLNNSKHFIKMARMSDGLNRFA